MGIDWDFGVVLFDELIDEGFIDLGIFRNHKNFVQRDHDLVNNLSSEVKTILKHIDFLIAKTVLSLVVEEKDCLNFLFIQLDFALIMLNELVKHIHDGLHKRAKDTLQKTNKWGEEVSDRDFVFSSTVSLWNDFSEYHNSGGGDEDGEI